MGLPTNLKIMRKLNNQLKVVKKVYVNHSFQSFNANFHLLKLALLVPQRLSLCFCTGSLFVHKSVLLCAFLVLYWFTVTRWDSLLLCTRKANTTTLIANKWKKRPWGFFEHHMNNFTYKKGKCEYGWRYLLCKGSVASWHWQAGRSDGQEVERGTSLVSAVC